MEFKLTNKNKVNLGRELKEVLKTRLRTSEDVEIAIMYNTIEESFYTISTTHIQREEYDQNVCYCIVRVNKQNKPKLTIKKLVEQIFSHSSEKIIYIR